MAVCQNIFQQVFCLSMRICSAAKGTGSANSLAAMLQDKLNAFYTNMDFTNGDTWSTQWGPVVWQAPSSQVVDQAVAVCFNKTQNIYVVAIAATNPNSSFDVFYEDLAVSPKYKCSFDKPLLGDTSAGNWAALQAILQMTDGGQSLSAFLKTVASSNGTLVFCGHSLGGGLTPLVAASLYPTGTASSGWRNVYTYGSAGPATATSEFAAQFNGNFPKTNVGPQKYAVWNLNQYNPRDIVPNAWAPGVNGPGLALITAGTDEAKMFYVNLLHADMIALVVALRGMAQSLASDPNAPTPNPYGAVNGNPFFMGDRQSASITNKQLLVAEIGYQHVQAYIEAFGVSALFPKNEVEGTIQPPLLTLAHTASVASVAAEATDPMQASVTVR